jgi:hypothetical protein
MLFQLQLREQDHVANAFLAEDHHAQAVNTGFERVEEIWLLLLTDSLIFQRGAA